MISFTFVNEAGVRRVCLMLIALMVILASGLTACSSSSSVDGEATRTAQKPKATPMVTRATGHIYLYGEAHGISRIMDKEYELWSDYYHNKGMRHLFVEQPYFTAEYLNLWMQSNNDDILEEIYKDSEGTAGHTPYTKTFFQKIKTGCPETIFHGTDVGHQRDTTGNRFLSYLADNDLTGSEMYTLTTEAIQQSWFYYRSNNDVYRENKMTENFIREFEKLWFMDSLLLEFSDNQIVEVESRDYEYLMSVQESKEHV